MKISAWHENTQRGTSDFPVDYYKIDENHPRYHMRTHWHKDIELLRVTKGHLEAQIGDVTYSLREGDSIYIPGGISHGATPTHCEYECIVFTPAIMYASQKIRTIIKSKITSVVTFFRNNDVDEIFENFSLKPQNFELKVLGLLYKVVFSALDNQPVSRTNVEHHTDKIKPAISYMEEHFASEISLSQLAHECSMSPNYFCKSFKSATGQTPVEYLTTYRIEVACEMLLTGSKVTDTAYDCGFNDLSYFIHVFKKNIGMSPKQYAQKRV